MDDKVSKLKSLADLRDTGILSEAEFEAEKAKILTGFTAPQQQYGAPQQQFGLPSQMMGGGKGNGPIPFKRRSGWLWWIAYVVIAIGGSIFSTVLYVDAIGAGDCYEDYWGYYCEDDYELIFIADMVSIVSSILTLIIWVYWTYSMYSEFNSFVGYEVQQPFLAACIPFFNLYCFYVFVDHLNKQAAHRGRQGFIDPTLTCCLTMVLGIGVPMYQSKLNEFWDIVAYERMNG
jgi:hypothetical protein